MFGVGQIAAVAFVATLVLASSGTSSGSAKVLQEVKFGTSGIRDASSVNSSQKGTTKRGPGKPYEAFDSNQHSWRSDGNKPFPHLIWIDLEKKAVIPARVAIRPAQYGSGDWKRYGPTTWEFIGSNDKTCNEESEWTVLCNDSYGAPFERKTQNKYCDVDESMTTSFKCLGISVLDTPDKESTGVMISNIRIWKKRSTVVAKSGVTPNVTPAKSGDTPAIQRAKEEFQKVQAKGKS